MCSWSGHELNTIAGCTELAAPSKPMALQELVQQQIRAGVAGEGSLPVRVARTALSTAGREVHVCLHDCLQIGRWLAAAMQ